MLLTPLLEGMTDITLRITIPAVTKISIKETTEKETIITSATLAMELTRSLLTETSTSLYTLSTATLETTVETKSTVQVTTPTVALKPPAITERPQTTTSIGETISVTERVIIVTTIKSTTALSGRTTLHEASKITYITRIETEMEDVTPFSTRIVTFATHVPTNATKMEEKITSVVKENKTTSIKEVTSGTIPKELKTAITEVLTTINVTAKTESTIKTSTITSEIITTRSATPTSVSSLTISEKTETISSTEAEVTASTPEEESPVTQIEKTITADEMTATETPTITEIPTTTEISTTIKTTATTETIEISTTGKSTTITKILTSIETPTVTKTSTVAAKTSKVPITITIIRTLMPRNLTTAKILTTEQPTKALTTIKPSVTTKIPTTIETTTITRILIPTNVTTTEISTTETLTPTETPTITELSTTTEISTTIKSTIITKTLMPTNVTTTEISTTETLTPTETPTITELSTTTEISTTIKSTIITKTLMPTNVTTTEISTTETLTPTKIPTITELSTTIEIPTTIETTIITRTLIPTNVTTTEISTTETLTPTETSTITELSTTTEISTTIESTIISETSTTSKYPTITKIATITESETYIETTTTTIEILTPTKTTTESPKISEISTTSETPIITETAITKTPTPTEILTIISTPTITETPIIIQTSPMAKTQTIIEIPVTTESSTIMETPTITSIYITTSFSIESTISTVTTKFPTKEFTSITPTIFTTIASTSAFSITPVTTVSFKTTVPVMSLESTTTTLSPLIANITLSETPCTTISSTFFKTTKELLTSTAVSTTEMVLTTSSILENATVFSTNISTITTEIYESTITTPSLTKIPIATPIVIATETTSYETTPTVISTTLSTQITESTMPTSTISPLETYEASTEEETTMISTTIEFTKEERTNWTTIEKITIISTAIFSTEKSTTSTTETSISLVPAITISATLPEITTETVETSLITTIAVALSTTEKPEYMTTTEVTVTFTPFFELPETEEFTTESLVYTTESSTTLFTEITTPLAISTSAASAERMPEIETEYYIAQGPQYEEYEDYDKEIPTGEWFDYEEYETTTKEEILSTVKYTKAEEGSTSPFYEKVTTVSLYETKISKFTTYSTSAAYTLNISSTPYTYVEEEVTSTLKTSIIAENTTTSEVETESTASIASEVEKSTTSPTFGSTEEYSLPSSTVFEITTKPLPLEYPTVSPEYTESTESTLESSTETTRNLTLPKFVTKPKEIPEIERITTSERILTETRVTVETSFFVSSLLTTLSEKEAVEVHVTIASPASRETAIETGYESTTRATTAMLITEEEYITPFIASETKFEFITTSVAQRDQLLQQLDRLKEHEREMAEREERLKERERQWDREKEERSQMIREKGEMENITSTIAGYVTTAVTNLTTLIHIVSTENLTASTSTEIEISSALATISLPEIITISTPFYSTEEITPATYTAEIIEQITTEESTTYVTTETEELAVLYTTERSTYITEELEKTRVTDYIIFTPYITTSITDLYGISITSIEATTPYSIEETYTSYGTIYVSEPSFTSPALLFTSTTTLAISTETEYEEIERLKEELRKRERELEERERILLEREKKLKKDILEFEKYMKEFEEEMIDRSSMKSTVPTSLSTPVPPIEKTTAKLEVTTLAITEKKENRTTTSRYKTTKVEGVEEKATTPLEEEKIVTKRICLNVLENTTIPSDKIRRGIVTKKICLPYFPEKNEKEKPVGRLSRKPLAFQRTREFRQPKHLSDFRFRKKRQERANTRKISNLQLLHHEWLSNETAKPLQHFKSFTRIYQKIRKPFLRNVAIINAQENAINNFYNITSLYERRVLDHYKNFFQPTTKSTLHSKKYEKRNAFLEYNLIPASKRQKFSNNDKINIKKRDISATKKNVRFLSTKNTVNISSQKATTAIAEKKELNSDEDEFYTVNVVQLDYNENEETHKVISAKPDENDLTVITITTPYYELEEEADLKEDDELSEETEKKIEEENDDIEDMIDNYMNYEERETSTLTYDTKFLDKDKNKRMTEGKAELLDQIWPTEKITSYHLGGTRFWELDFKVTETSVSNTATDKSTTFDLSVTKTTCFHVILKNERHSDSEIKRNIHNHKQNTYNNKTKKYNIKKKDTSLKNVTRKNALRNKLRIKWSGATMKELKYNLQNNLHGSNHHKQNSERKRMVKPGEFPLSVFVAGNESSIIARSRKLCGVKEKKKHEKHKDAVNIKNKTKLAKSQKSQNVTLHSPKNYTDSCITNKKNSDKHHKTKIAKTTANHNFHVKKSVTHPNVIVDHKNKSISHKRKHHDCFNCICDITNVINDIKSILDKTSFPLDEIKALNCNKYKETQDKIMISMNSDMEEAKEFPQSHYNTEFLKGQKYIKLEELEDDFKSDLELENDHDIISLPGLNLNLPCSQDGDGITWLSSISRPSYTWKRTDGIALFGFVAENGDLELRNVNAKDTGNYTCVITYMGPDNEEPVETTYEIHLQVVTLPRYILYGENRYHIRSCDERDMDVLVTYLPLKLNSIICEEDLCNAFVLPPTCTRNQITVNILIVPSHIVKLMTVDPKHCNVLCLKAIQDKLSLVLSRNLQIFLGKTNYLITNRDWCRLLKRPQDGKEEGRVQIRSVKNPAILACFPVVQLDMVFVVHAVFLVIWTLIARMVFHIAKNVRPVHISRITAPEFVARALIH
ncbi:mucin-2-like isoform X2 [Linepithema humile]|uniref:mucin-2-like isoform X2 n=1 Tax=Linepithema humile TaxID=83485 RepID=UPI00351EBC78